MKTVKSTAVFVTGILLAGQAHGQNTPPAIPAPGAIPAPAAAAATNTAPALIPAPARSTAAPAPSGNPTISLPLPPTATPRAFTNLLSTNTTVRSLPANTSPSGLGRTNRIRTLDELNNARIAAQTNRPTLVPPGVAGALASTPPTEGSAAAAGQPTAAKEEAIYSYNLEGGTLDILLKEYFQLIGKIPLRSGVAAPTKVDGELKVPFKTPTGMKLTKTEAITYLETILGMNGIALVPIGEKFVKVVPEAVAGAAAPEFSNLTADQIPSTGNIIQKVVQLKYITLQDAITAVTPFFKTPGAVIQLPSTQTLILRDYAENVKRMLEVIEKVDQVIPIEVKPEVIPIKYALAGDIQNVLGSLTPSGAGATVGQSRSSALGRPAGSTGGLGGAGGFGAQGAIGGNRLGATAGGTSPFASAGASGATGTAFNSRINNIIARASGQGEFQILGSVKIIADERTNSLLVFATDQDMVMIKSIIEKLDVVLAQVLIESIILEVSTNDSLNYGVSAGQPRTQNGKLSSFGGMNNGQNFPNSATNALSAINSLPGGFSYFGQWGNDLDVAVTAIAKNGTVNVLSRPRVQTSHAVPATLKIGNTVPYVTGTFFGGGSIGGQSSSQYQQTFVGIDLQVTPLINPDGLVVMDIVQDIQQLGTPTSIDGNNVPTTTQRAASAKVAVRDRETIILGGFMSKQSTKTKSGVPFLKDIPGLGALFRSTGNDGQQVELMVLIRPTVLPTPEAAALEAAEQRDKMPGIKRAELESREEERRQEKAVEKEMRKKLGLKSGG